MTKTNHHITIDPKRVLQPIEDYTFLRNEGLKKIRLLSSKLWTDHNIHDPGITILELLCYALTDLGYRMNFPIADILTEPGANHPIIKDSFHLADEILPSHPITFNDYRKLLIDQTPGLRNVWLEKQNSYTPSIYYNTKNQLHSFSLSTEYNQPVKINGLIRVIVELEDYDLIFAHYKAFLHKLTAYRPNNSTSITELIEKAEYKICYQNYILTLLNAHRNLCEDFYTVDFLDDEWIGICADIELQSQANAQTVLIQIYSQLYNHIQPAIPLYSLDELLSKGYQVEDAFSGPLPTRGFIDGNELVKFDRKKSIYSSDIINILSDIDGVKSIREISLNSYRYNQTLGHPYVPIKTGEPFRLNLSSPNTAGFKFCLDFNNPQNQIINRFNFYKEQIGFNVKISSGAAIRRAIKQKTPENFTVKMPLPESQSRNLNQFIALQNEFPANYAVGPQGIAKSASDLRKAQRIQLKGYLHFFEQLLADYLEQLNGLKRLFSWKESSWDPTYFIHHISDSEISDLHKVLVSNYSDGYKELTETPTERKERRNRLLNHLLARFNEKIVDYSIVKFRQSEKGTSYRSFSTSEMIRDKNFFLKNYPEISCNRSNAIDYLHQHDAKNRAMLEKRLQIIFGIENNKTRLIEPVLDNSGNLVVKDGKPTFYDNRTERFDNSFGFHLIEHLLLRPLIVFDENDIYETCGSPTGQNCFCSDPFSMQMTLIMPGWLPVAGNMAFRKFAEEKIRVETPAHIALKICWINPVQMYRFETAYVQFLEVYRKMRSPIVIDHSADYEQYKSCYRELASILSGLMNIYPPSQLVDCSTIQFDEYGNPLQEPVLLNATMLAEGENEDYLLVNKEKNNQ